jgi:hippurate hydrolase
MNIPVTPTALHGAEQESLDQSIPEFVALRHDLHRHPELAFHESRTSALIAERLTEWGYEVTTGIAETGVVGTLRMGNGPRHLGLRADIDALPIQEATALPYASATAGVMHACGHDGHTAILLAAAKHLAETRDFNGTLHLIFQPAEEIGGGARRMLAEGLLERFPLDAIYGLHNWPGEPVGKFGFVEGPAMAAVDQINATIHGKGGHGAAPHEAVDPVVAAAQVITALQTIVSRNVDPLEAAVVTVGSIHGGHASNVIPGTVDLSLTLRSYSEAVRDLLQARLPALISAVSEGLGATAEVLYRRGFPSVVNHASETAFVRQVARDTFGQEAVIDGFRPRTASEDFAFFLEQVPGSFLFVGTGDGAPLHSPDYRFNDAIIGPAAAFWVALARRFLTGETT